MKVKIGLRAESRTMSDSNYEFAVYVNCSMITLFWKLRN